MSYWKARLSAAGGIYGRAAACHGSSPSLARRRAPPYFTRLPGIFCLHNIYPTADTKSNGAWVPGGAGKRTGEIGN